MSSHEAVRPSNGFTITELLAILAASAVVGALAYSAYRTFVGRTQVAEGVRETTAVRHAVEAAFRRSGEVPATIDEVRLSSAAAHLRLVGSVTVENGRIDLVFGERADSAIAGRRLSLTPYETASAAIVWICGNEIAGPGLAPLGFAGGGRQPIQIATTVEARYLPAGCR